MKSLSLRSLLILNKTALLATQEKLNQEKMTTHMMTGTNQRVYPPLMWQKPRKGQELTTNSSTATFNQ